MELCTTDAVRISIMFATKELGKKLLSERDDFIQRTSPFDRSARMKTSQPVSEEEFLAFIGRNTLDWDESEKAMISEAFQGVKASLDKLRLPIEDKIQIIKTTGKEEGNAAYTRGNAIVFPSMMFSLPVENIRKTLCHELFHIISRKNPDLKEELYKVIGFKRCPEVCLPGELLDRRVTNPDAPVNDHYINLKVNKSTRPCVPVLYSTEQRYNPERGGEFFQYIAFAFQDQETSVIYSVEEIDGLFEQIGRNTKYIVHPEEILADNFAFLVLKREPLPSPEIVSRINDVLTNYSKSR